MLSYTLGFRAMAGR